MSEVPMGSRDDVLAGGGTGGTKSSPMAFPIPAMTSLARSRLFPMVPLRLAAIKHLF